MYKSIYLKKYNYLINVLINVISMKYYTNRQKITFHILNYGFLCNLKLNCYIGEVITEYTYKS